MRCASLLQTGTRQGLRPGCYFALILLLWAQAALAGGPRYVTGPPFFTGTPGRPVAWAQGTLGYSTDAGALSNYVSKTQADALVAAAAAVWNQPVAGITLQQAGTLAEHVSGSNIYVGAGGVVWPADVSSSNAAAVPVAVVYDSDGSVTDTLLGAGASLPSGCRQNAVTETVDRFDPAGYILHAIIILNGRCTGSAAAAQLQMQYQLVRVWGRVLGLAWSQANDNVFTGTPTPTYAQAQHWPIMHPIDILCGTYSYQCLPNPFTLRPDDLSGLVGLYPITGSPANGKVLSYGSAAAVGGQVQFPTGEGMQGVNVLVSRQSNPSNVTEAWVEASGVTGAWFRRNGVSPFATPGTDALSSEGTTDQNQAGSYGISYVPLTDVGIKVNFVVSMEAVNPLYSGSYSLGPYATGTVTPSGSAPTPFVTYQVPAASTVGTWLTPGDAASTCGNGLDGSAATPAPEVPSGWWTGILCGYGHAAYELWAVQPNRTLTVEVTALNEGGAVTLNKARPVIGVWGASDAASSLPTVASALNPFNALAAGMTNLTVSTGQYSALRIGIADQRGDGRPDFSFQARILYADSITPTTLPPAGGSITLSGTGFRPGNSVLINGVAAAVLNWSATQMTVVVPAMSDAGATSGKAVDVQVRDSGTGGTSTISGGLTYQVTPPNTLQIVSAPSGNVSVGAQASVPLTVRVLKSDGVNPVAGEQVVFAATAGSVNFAPCAAASCTQTTDANGAVSVQVTPTNAGAVTLQAMDGTVQVTASFTAVALDAQLRVVQAPSGVVPMQTVANPPFQVQAIAADGSGSAGRVITYTVTAGNALLGGCHASTCAATTDSNGYASMSVEPMAAGSVSITAADGALTQTITLTARSNADTMLVLSAPSGNYMMGVDPPHLKIQLIQPDGVSTDNARPVTFSIDHGATLWACLQAACQLTTDSYGQVETGLRVNTPGTYTVTAQFGSLSQSATFTVVQYPMTMTIVSMPGPSQAVGATANNVFAVQVRNGDGSFPSGQISFSGPQNAVSLGICGNGSCHAFLDSNGYASTTVIPLRPGTISLSASFLSLSQTASFTAIGTSDAMQVVSSPGNSTYPGDTETFKVAVTGPDGLPAAGRAIHWTVPSGSFQFTGCTATATCDTVTGADGSSSASGVATASGSLTVMAGDGAITQSMSFSTLTLPNRLLLVSAPVSTVYQGKAASPAFAVRLTGPDGITPLAGVGIAFGVTQGAATMQGCAALPCTVVTDTSGLASVTVIGGNLGALTVYAGVNGLYQTTSMTVLTAPDVLNLISSPSNGAYRGVNAAPIFAVQALLGNGAAAAVGRNINFQVTGGGAGFPSCSGAATCSATTDSTGMAALAVQPSALGTVSLQATDTNSAATPPVTGSFTVVPRPDGLAVISAPASGGYSGVSGAPTLSVQVSNADPGASVAGRTVVLRVTSGVAGFDACNGASTCTLATDANGVVTTGVTPQSIGVIGLQAADGSVTATSSFITVARPDVLTLVSAPANGGFSKVTGAPAFAVRVTSGDTGNPVPGRTLLFSVASGSAGFGACAGATTCSLVTDSAGLASSLITPAFVGTISLQAAEGSVMATASFTTVARPDVLAMTSMPESGGFQGVAPATAFAVRVTSGDTGVGEAGRSVLLSVTSGSAGFVACGGASTCTLTTDAAGMVSSAVMPGSVGTITLQAADGPVTATSSFSTIARPDVLTVVSVPASGGFRNVTAAPVFSIRVTNGDTGAPIANRGISLSVTAGTAGFDACSGAATCLLRTDSTGTVSSPVTPSTLGNIGLQAADGAILASASFSTVARPDVLTLLSLPSGGGYMGANDAVPMTVQVTDGDTGAPVAGRTVVLSAIAGSATFAACNGSAACSLVTSGMGTVSTTVTPGSVGLITLQAADGTILATGNFHTVARPDVLTVVSAPASGGYMNVTGAPAFAVRVTSGDTGEAIPGKPVVFSTMAGAVNFAACAGASTCQAVTDSQGLAVSLVTPVSLGAVSLMAADGSVTASASFAVSPRPPVLSVVSIPADGGFTGIAGTPAFTVKVTDGDTGAVVTGKSVVFSVTGGQAAFAACGSAPSCILTLDAAGLVTTVVTPGSVGLISLEAAVGTVSAVASFHTVSRPDVLTVLSVPASGGYNDAAGSPAFSVQVKNGDTGAPVAGKTVSLTVTSGTATFGACGGTPSCSLTTDSQGLVSSLITPSSVGTVTLQATDGTGSTLAQVSASFTTRMKPDTLTVVSAPTSVGYVGEIMAVPFTVKLLKGDGVTPDAGQTIRFSVTSGTATLAAVPAGCGEGICTVITDAAGVASVNVVPGLAGSISVSAAYLTLTQPVTVQALHRADKALLLSQPAASVYVQREAGTLSLRLLLADGVTPISGVPVAFTQTGPGVATFEVCGAASCTVLTDASGVISTAVLGASPGATLLTATPDALSGAAALSVPLSVLAETRSVTTGEPATYLAENAIFSLTMDATALLDASAAANLPVTWTGAAGLRFTGPVTSTASNGTATASAVLGPLAGGTEEDGSACAWGNVCATLRVFAVPAGQQRLQVVSGASQSLNAGLSATPVVLQVVDGAGHPVAGATVQVYQEEVAVSQACPPHGRCPAAPVLGSQATVLVSDRDGAVQVAPFQVPGVPGAAETRMQFTVGVGGTASAVVDWTN